MADKYRIRISPEASDALAKLAQQSGKSRERVASDAILAEAAKAKRKAA